jgi:Fe-S-cluster-containing dehydrogenase component
MALLQDVDKCIRCNGCYIACKRTWKMAFGDFKTRGQHRVAAYQRVVIKSMKKPDMGPFIRFSCWHCVNPPCAGRCPFNAIVKRDNGAVDVDMTLCNPGGTNSRGIKCVKQCVTDCQKGGYPKVDVGNLAGQNKAFKCTMCYGQSGYIKPDGSVGGTLPTKAKKVGTQYQSALWEASSPADRLLMDQFVPELEHLPSCVMTCPAKAMTWDTRKNVLKYLSHYNASDNGGYYVGEGGMFWCTTKSGLPSPKADPFIEDHVAPMVSSLMSSPFAAAAIVPTLVVGGLLALSARREENEKEASLAMEGEV